MTEKTSPVNDVVETASLGYRQVLVVIVVLARGVWVEVLRIPGVEVGLQTKPLRGTKPGVLQPNLIFLSILIQHNELVLLPVASFGVWCSLGGLHSRALGQARILTAA